MSLPAAATPVAVLVLAWDEATPAVRALVEATVAEPLLDSVVVLVPAGPADVEALTLEEFFPIAPLPEPLAALPPSTSATPLVAAAATPLPHAPALPKPPLTKAAASAGLLGVAAPAAATAPPAAVRVLHLSAFSLPALAILASQALPRLGWSGQAALPAAPYVGSTAEAFTDENTLFQGQTTDNQVTIASEPTSQPAIAAPPLPPLPATEPPVAGAASSLLSYLPGESRALDGEADAAPTLLAEGVALPGLDAPLATEFAAVRAGWPEALASLRQPLAVAEPTPPAAWEAEMTSYADAPGAGENQPAPLGPPVALALRPASQAFGAPNLNFQIIQYARFAVPVALAEAPFAAIYAPAWPTWLAAQELRQRTGRPLVLHVTTLAAHATESVETATGWQAELQRQALHRADLILAETAALTRRLRQDLGLPPALVRTVPAADAAAIAQALHDAQTRPTVSMS